MQLILDNKNIDKINTINCNAEKKYKIICEELQKYKQEHIKIKKIKLELLKVKIDELTKTFNEIFINSNSTIMQNYENKNGIKSKNKKISFIQALSAFFMYTEKHVTFEDVTNKINLLYDINIKRQSLVKKMDNIDFSYYY